MNTQGPLSGVATLLTALLQVHSLCIRLSFHDIGLKDDDGLLPELATFFKEDGSRVSIDGTIFPSQALLFDVIVN